MFNDDNEVEEVVEVEEEEETEEEAGEETKTEKELALEAENKKLKAILDRNKNKIGTPQKSNDFGYDVKAYLKASGIKANEFDFVKAELKSSGTKDVDTLLENEYFQAKLEKHRELGKTQDAIPSGKRSGGVATDSVEYWMAKPIEDVPLDKRRAVVNAKLEQEKNKGKFYNA